MRVIIQPNYEKASQWAANYVARKILDFAPVLDKPFVLGLPTGSSPLGMYRELATLNKAGKLSFEHVITFNMDEYVGLPQDHPESYHSFMWHNFFGHINIPKRNVNILDGNAPDLAVECAEYESRIRQVGGIRLFVGGIGADGHIAFNEPGSSLASRTRQVRLTQDTRIVNSRFFGNDPSKVPETALSVGVGTVMDADEVIIIVNGANKARALRHAIEEGVNHMWTVSALQMHPNGIIVCDEDATLELKVGTAKYFKDVEAVTLDPATLLA
ncbi:MAG: glucosamine-6-phosphate deaminase [Phycisphaerales bacterium]